MSVFVTGYGVISAIGNNAEACFDALVQERTGIKTGASETVSKYKAGEVSENNDELKQRLGISGHCSRTALLGISAAREAFEGHQLHSGIRTGLISGTSVGGIDLSETEYKRKLSTGVHDVEVYRQHDSGTTTEHIASSIGISGYVNTISTACSSAANAIMLGARMIENGQLDRVVVGGADSLSSFTVSGFRSLMIFDTDWCRPFDASRRGLNLGEGAGFLVLESAKSLEISGKQPLTQLLGWNNSSDAFHQTASSPEGKGATLCMSLALEKAGLKPADIDYINAHGTATENNDLTESLAMINIFGENVPAFSSTKAYTGHTLAASGGIEAVFSILAIRNGVIYPNLNFTTPISETGLLPATRLLKEQEVRNVVSNAFGFGGNSSSLIFGKI